MEVHFKCTHQYKTVGHWIDAGSGMDVKVTICFQRPGESEQIRDALALILKNQGVMMSNFDQLKKDQQDLKDAVTSETQILGTIAGIIASDKTTIDNLNQQIADLKAAQPDFDLSDLEASIAQLQSNNTTASGLVPAAA